MPTKVWTTDMTCVSKIKSRLLNILYMSCKANIFIKIDHILDTNGLGVYKTTNGLDCWYYLGDKYQDQMNQSVRYLTLAHIFVIDPPIY